MPDLKVNNVTPTNIKLGSLNVDKIYQGSILVWPIDQLLQGVSNILTNSIITANAIRLKQGIISILTDSVININSNIIKLSDSNINTNTIIDANGDLILPAPVFLDNGGIGSNIGQSVNVNYTSTNNKDILLMVVFDEADVGINTPSGWTLITSVTLGGGNGAWSYWWKRANGTETGFVTITSITNDAVLIAGIMYRFAGCVTIGTPFEAQKIGIQTAGTTLTNLANINSSGKNRLAVGMFAIFGDFLDNMTLNGWTQSDLSVDLLGNDSTFILTTKELPISGTNAGTITANLSTSTRGVVNVIYLKS